MGSPSPFQTCWDRVDRAEAHRKSLINRWNTFDTSQAYTSRGEIDDDGTRRLFIEPVKTDWTLPLSLELGEMLYQLRSALDSCVYDAAVLKFGDPPPNAQKWQFPVTSDPAEFKEAIRRMKDIPADVASLIERVQGYSRVTCTFNDTQFDIGPTLVILNDWARIDRHRQLHLVGTALSGGNLMIASPVGMGVEYCNFLGGDVLENQSEIARFKIRNFTPGTAVQLHPKFTFEVMVNESPRVRLNEIALAMGMSVSVTRELFENHFGITR